jgi:hypothetical protein
MCLKSLDRFRTESEHHMRLRPKAIEGRVVAIDRLECQWIRERTVSELTADVFVSLDGFSAGRDGGQNWIGEYANPGSGSGNWLATF